MAFGLAAFSYIIALIADAFLIFLAIFHVIAFDELKTDYKSPIDQCASLNPLVLPEYILHLAFNVLFLFAGEFFSLCLNIPLIAYHINRYSWKVSEGGLDKVVLLLVVIFLLPLWNDLFINLSLRLIHRLMNTSFLDEWNN